MISPQKAGLLVHCMSSQNSLNTGRSTCIAGVIAEYNPFHDGHSHHLAQTRKAGADYIVVVMSTCFMQRGDLSIIPVKDRVRMALEGGADAVFALPVPWALRDAEHFAMGGVSLLSGLGCNCISFGSETQELPLLQQIAELLENPPDAMLQVLHTRLNEGCSYPSAVAYAAESIVPEASSVLSKSNNTLAICYLRQLLRQKSQMVPICIPRDSCYLDTQIHDHQYASASAVRSAIRRGDWQAIEKAIPESSLAILRRCALEGHIMHAGSLDSAILCSLRSLTDADWNDLEDQTEGLPDRVRNALKTAASVDDLITLSCTRRYTRARVTRLALHAFLHMRAQSLPSFGPQKALLLGVRNESADLLHKLGPMKILGKASDLNEDWCMTEKRAWDLWAVGCGMPMGSLMTHGIVRI